MARAAPSASRKVLREVSATARSTCSPKAAGVSRSAGWSSMAARCSHTWPRLGDLPKGQTVIRRAVLLQRRPQRLNGAAQHHDLGPQVLEGPRGSSS